MKSLFNTPTLKIDNDTFMLSKGFEVFKSMKLNSYGNDKFPDSFFKHDDIEYSLNHYAFRSEEFSTIDTSSDFLFAGCSQTFGLGLPIDATWPKKLNEMLNGKKFFNLATVSSDVTMICYNVTKYIDTFGKPKSIFILFPDFYKKIKIHNNEITTEFIFDKKKFSAEDVEENLLRDFMSIRNLEVLCDFLNIPLFYSSWQIPLVDVLMKLKEKNILKHVFDINHNHVVDSSSVNKKDAKFPHYWDVARDNEHFGEFDNLCFALRFKYEYEHYKK